MLAHTQGRSPSHTYGKEIVFQGGGSITTFQGLKIQPRVLLKCSSTSQEQMVIIVLVTLRYEPKPHEVRAVPERGRTVQQLSYRGAGDGLRPVLKLDGRTEFTEYPSCQQLRTPSPTTYMLLISTIHVSAALLWTVYAAPVPSASSPSLSTIDANRTIASPTTLTQVQAAKASPVAVSTRALCPMPSASAAENNTASTNMSTSSMISGVSPCSSSASDSFTALRISTLTRMAPSASTGLVKPRRPQIMTGVNQVGIVLFVDARGVLVVYTTVLYIARDVKPKRGRKNNYEGTFSDNSV
ncbi:hypothetical protein DFH06DRAFT_1297675 [Mycena polygramma]|nr:hypothetical protein DFH06DRAFT_1297675 [Mycena polygramma]